MCDSRYALNIVAAFLLAAGASPAAAQSVSLSAIVNADLQKIPSGCSFVLYDAERKIVAISTNPLESRVSFWFKAGGRLLEAHGAAQKSQAPGYIRSWSGELQGVKVVVTKRTVAGNRNKPGEDPLHHGAASLDIGGASRAVTWEAGC